MEKLSFMAFILLALRPKKYKKNGLSSDYGNWPAQNLTFMSMFGDKITHPFHKISRQNFCNVPSVDAHRYTQVFWIPSAFPKVQRIRVPKRIFLMAPQRRVYPLKYIKINYLKNYVQE
jgi:hypothetical protein